MPEIEPQEPAATEPELGEFGEMSFEESMRAAVGQANEDIGVISESPAEPPPASEEPTQQDLGAPEPESETPAEEPAADVPEDRSLARIMQKEQDLLHKQTKMDAAEGELNELRGRLDSYETAQRNFQQDPVAAIRALAPNLDLKRLAEGLWYENQGDKAPAKYLEQKVANRHNTELVDRIAKLEQGNDERNQAHKQNEAQREIEQYKGSLDSYAESVSKETHPWISAMHAKNPQMVSGALFNIAQNHAQQTGGQTLTNEQLAESLEKELAYYQLGAPAPENVPTPQPQGTSLRNSSQQVQPDRVVEDELSDEYLHQMAMEAAKAAIGP